MSTYKLPCGCVIQRETSTVERVVKLCDCCSAEFNERHQASAAERAADRSDLWAAALAEGVTA